MKRIFLTLTILLYTIVSIAQPTQQNISATGSILSEISIISAGNLEFGTITREQDNIILVSDENAGRFLMSIEEVGEILLTFDLPTHLTHDDDGNNSQVPLTFNNTSAGYGTADQSGQQSTTFNPNTPTAIYFHDSQEDWHIYIGGIATPGLDAPMGDYSAEITLTAEYN